MARPPRVTLTTLPEAQEAADECLKEGGTALDAALAAYFATAGATTWGLFAPVTILVAGHGTGVRAIDGRARQPGQGIDRPVRYNDEEAVPPFAWAAAPATAAAISLAASMFGSQTLTSLARIGARIARKHGAKARATQIERLGASKAWVMQDKSLLAEIAERVPRFEGALLQPADLAIEGAEVLACDPTEFMANQPVSRPPWHDPQGPVRARALHLASDRGTLAGVVSEAPVRFIPLFDGEVDLPGLAVPMLKGVPRLRPGSPLPMAAPLAVLFEKQRPVWMAGSQGPSIDQADLETLLVGQGLVDPAQRSNQMLAVRAIA